MDGAGPRSDPPRRASVMRDELLAMARTMAPAGAADGGEGDFGAALFEIAARLAEQSTRRLDQTPLRDKLDFLDRLDIAAMPPRAATVPVVFTLSEKRDEPVFAPARVQLLAEREKADPLSFETREAIALTPARLTRIVAADPANDRLETAPAAMLDLAGQKPAPVRYRLVAAVEAGALFLQLAQAEGIEEGDLLRLAGSIVRVAAVKGEMVELMDPAAAAPAGAEVEKIVRLEAFALRNQQEHVAYFGHKEMLKLDGPSSILLHFEPAGLARRLAQLGIGFDIWAVDKTSGTDAPDWQKLALTGSDESTLYLDKGWDGPVEEAEVGGQKSRWLRLSLHAPIPSGNEPDTHALSVAFEVLSLRPDDDALGSRSIARALHNAQSLSTSTAFLPFGPEPQRFDTFSIAAPEALSKKGATVKVVFTLSDATPEALAFPINASSRAYGIGRDGRLQNIGFKSDGTLDWTQIATSGSGAGLGPRLDSRRPLFAMELSANPLRDVAFAAGKDGRLWLGKVEAGSTAEPLVEWTELPREEGEPAFEEYLLFPAPLPPAGLLLAADETGLFRRTLSPLGAAEAKWHPVASFGAPISFAKPALLVAARGTTLPAVLVLIDKGGNIFRGAVASDGSAVTWSAIAPPPLVDTDVRPAALLDETSTSAGDLLVAGVSTTGDLFLLRVSGIGVSVDLLPTSVNFSAIGDPATILCWPGLMDLGSDRPLLVAIGTDGYLVWTHKTLAATHPLPPSVDPDGVRAALLRPPANPADPLDVPSLLLNASRELLLYAPFERTEREVDVARFDLVRGPGVTAADHVLLNFATPVAIGLAPPPIDFPLTGQVYALAPSDNLSLAPAYQFLAKKMPAGPFPGTVGTGSVLSFASGDTNVAVPGDFLLIGGQPHALGAGNVLTPALSGSVSYTKLEPVGPLQVPAPGEIRTLIQLQPASLPVKPSEVAVLFPTPTVPAVQIVEQASPQPSPWLLLPGQWGTPPPLPPPPPPAPPPPPPPPPRPKLLGALKVGAWKAYRLPRSNQKPELVWEYHDGKGWRRLNVTDGTANFAHGGVIEFIVPADLQPVEIAGHEDYWIRGRLEGGDYGTASYVVDTSIPNQQSIRIDRSRLNPPEILSVEVDYQLARPVPPQSVFTLNNLALIDQSQAAAADGASFLLFEGIDPHVDEEGSGPRALYLCFSKPPGVNPLSFFADALDHEAAVRTLKSDALTIDGWEPVPIDDETGGLSRPGRLRVFLTADPARLPLFGRDGWWIRLRPSPADAGWAPDLRGLFVNAAIAEQARSVRQENLGSSLGEPGQSYALVETPVLPDSLELRVREALSDEEKTALVATAGDPEAVRAFPDLEGEWVRWMRVDSLVGFDGGARVFRLDARQGIVSFGDGQRGRIPPAGRDSIRAIAYQAGGGAIGNVPARTVKTLRSALESVEQVFNPIDAGGGAESPGAEGLAATGPDRLRHAGRALGPADVEALVVASAPDVVRARCLRSEGCAIDVAVAIRSGDERCPIPSRTRREGIAAALAEHGWGALAADAIRVRPPLYVPLRVDAELIAIDADAVAHAGKTATEALLAFLHPLDGGPGRAGWSFGERVWRGHLQHVLAGVPGVDRVATLAFAVRDGGVSLDDLPPHALICADPPDVRIEVVPPGAAP